MDFVTFHVSLANGAEVHPNQTSQHKEYMAMIDMMFASVRSINRSARAVILTDSATDFGLCRTPIDAIVRSTELNITELMLERTRNQLRFVEKSGFTEPIVILDSDILINRPLDSIFNNDFDVAVTWRENKDQPINGGVLILNNRRPEVSRRFFRKFASIFLERYADKAAWWGDQLALRDCVGLTLEEMRGNPLVDVDGCKVLLLSCDSYNFSPKNSYAEIQGLRSEAVLHFKGERKRLMAPYWHAWLKPKGSLSPVVHLRARQERRSIGRLLASELTTTASSKDSTEDME